MARREVFLNMPRCVTPNSFCRQCRRCWLNPDWRWRNLDAIAFGRGPGSFTSLRIGIGVVQGLAWGAELPVVPVSSLAAVAQEAADTAVSGFSSICVAVDARMQEVYTANFRCGGNGIVASAGEEHVCEPGRVRALAGGPYIAAGNGFETIQGTRSTGVECG